MAQGIVDEFVKDYKASHKGAKFSDRDIVENRDGKAYTDSTKNKKGEVYATRGSDQESNRTNETARDNYDSGRRGVLDGTRMEIGISSLTDEQRRRIREVISVALDSTTEGRRENVLSVVDSVTSIILGSREFDQMLTERYPGLIIPHNSSQLKLS